MDIVLPQNFLVALCFLLGGILGSFANVVIVRFDAERGWDNVTFPPSHCQNCKTQVSWFHNIPIFSWFILRGKCPHCGTRFSLRYSLVELLTAVLFALLAYKFGYSWRLVELCYFAFALVICSFIDLDTMLLPDVFTLSGVAIGLLGAMLIPERSFWDAFFGALVGGGFLYAVAVLYQLVRKQEGMGGGDIKLLAWIGAVLGWQSIPIVILFASVLGMLAGFWQAFRTKGGLQQPIPFGPHLALAAIMYVLLDLQFLAQIYLRLHGLEDLP